MVQIALYGIEHGDETRTFEVVDNFNCNPVQNVKADPANLVAALLGRRYVCVNQAIAWPGDPCSPFNELRNAARIRTECLGNYATGNLHNFTGDYGMNFAMVDAKRGVSGRVLGLFGRLGIRTVLLSSHGGMQRYVRNGFVLELDPNGLGKDHKKLRAEFDGLANDRHLPEGSVRDFKWFTFIGSAHVDRFRPDELTDRDRRSIFNFNALPEHVAARLGVQKASAYLVTYRHKPNNAGYWGELVTPSPVPDDWLWQS